MDIHLLLVLDHVHHLEVSVVAVIFIVFVLFDLLLATLDLHTFTVIVVALGIFVLVHFLHLFLLLEDADLVSKQVKVLLLNNLTEVLLREGELLRVLIVLLLQVLQEHLLLILVQLVQVDHHLRVVVAALRLQQLLLLVGVHLLLLLLLLLTFLFALVLRVLLLRVAILYFELFVLVVFKLVVAFFRLVDDVLLHDELLQLAHLVRVQIEAHFLGGGD